MSIETLILEEASKIKVLNTKLESELDGIKKKEPTSVRDSEIILLLDRTLELSKSFDVVVEGRFPEVANLILRALLETLFHVQWIAISEENAIRFSEASKNDFLSNMKGNLKWGNAEIRNIETGDIVTKEFTEKLEKTAPKLIIGDEAREGGLGKVYSMIYGIISSRTHGLQCKTKQPEIAEDVYALTAATYSTTKCVCLVATQWIYFQRNIPSKDILTTLGLPITA